MGGTALAVLADLPWPPRSGNHLRDLQTLRLLRLLGYDVVVVAGARNPRGGRAVGPDATAIAVVDVPDESVAPKARARRLFRLITGGTDAPGPWALVYEDAGLGDAIVHALRESAPDAVVLRSTLAHWLGSVREEVDVVVLDVHDAEMLQARTVAGTLPLHRRLGALARVVAARRLDRAMRAADELWVPSPREREHYRVEAPGTKTIVVPNGVEVGPLPPWRPRRPELLLVGGFGYPPNTAAAVRLVERILPRVRAELPDAVVTLVGRDLPPTLVARWRRAAGVEWLGVVDDLDEVYLRPAICVVPYGTSTESGTPLKVAEAAARGLPVVATPNATAALGLADGVHVLSRETDAELAAAVVQLVREPRAAEDLVLAAHAWARAHLTPDRIAERLATESILGRREAALGSSP